MTAGIPETLTATRLREIADAWSAGHWASYDRQRWTRELRGWADWLDAQPADPQPAPVERDWKAEATGLGAMLLRIGACYRDAKASLGGDSELLLSAVTNAVDYVNGPLREALTSSAPAVSGRVTPTEPAQLDSDATATGFPSGEAEMAAALAPFGWTCGPVFWNKYYSDAWTFNLANAVVALSRPAGRVTPTREDAARVMAAVYVDRPDATLYDEAVVDALVAAGYLQLAEEGT